MSYYDPKVYNYSQLKDDDKTVFNNMVLFMIDPLESLIATREFDLSDEEATLFEKAKVECEVNALKQAEEYLQAQLIEFLVATIDNYEGVLEDEDLTDTDDYFFGCPFVKEESEEDEE